MDGLHCVHPLICWWTSGVFSNPWLPWAVLPWTRAACFSKQRSIAAEACHHSHGAAFMLPWQSWRVVSETVWPKICTIWLFTGKICWPLSEWVWELGYLGETARLFFFLLNMCFLLLVDNVLISAVQQSGSIIHIYVYSFLKIFFSWWFIV